MGPGEMLASFLQADCLQLSQKPNLPMSQFYRSRTRCGQAAFLSETLLGGVSPARCLRVPTPFPGRARAAACQPGLNPRQEETCWTQGWDNCPSGPSRGSTWSLGAALWLWGCRDWVPSRSQASRAAHASHPQELNSRSKACGARKEMAIWVLPAVTY